MSLTKSNCEKFTAFDKLALEFSHGVNIFVGANGTGKAHLMKIAYAACDITKTKMDFAEKLSRVFLPSGRALGRMVKRYKQSSRGMAEVHRADCSLRVSFSNHVEKAVSATVTGQTKWMTKSMESIYDKKGNYPWSPTEQLDEKHESENDDFRDWTYSQNGRLEKYDCLIMVAPSKLRSIER